MSQNRGKITLGATGDILLHRRLYNKAKTKTGKYDFSEMLSEVKPLFKEDHLIIVNQESIIGGEELGLSSFPRFNSPVEIGYELKNMNVDIVNIANNHTLDYGEKGVLKSIENWERIGIPYVGAYKSKKDQETLRIIHKNGIRVCFLSYTVMTNGNKVPKGKEYLVSRYNHPVYKGRTRNFGIRVLVSEIKKQDLADVIVVSIHFGSEYQMYPTSYQVELASSLADAGANIIIGHHPHVLQPPAFLTNSKGIEVFTAYSLGNFFTGQRGLYRQIGAYMTIDVEYPKKGSDKMVNVLNPAITLTYVDSSDKKDYKMYLLKDVVESQKIIKTDSGEFDSQDVYERMIHHMRKWIPDIEIK